MKEKSTMELLAPAGSFEILKAVIEAGADAVYLGGPSFGARAYAGNFTQEELLEALDWAHQRGVKIYLTVNTLLKNDEIAGIPDYLAPFYERGLDAVLVQDLGVCGLIRECFPDLEIHTSTQMTITASDGVRLMEEYGVSRVVMAREVSLAEMKKIHDETGMELEAFVHGALCYCYSGQCLFSSLLGGRSGNRGRCAQPCRLPYTVTGDGNQTLKKESYVLSLKDMCGIDDLEALYEAGVYSLKIEGRMKSAAYAAGVVSIYRKYLDLLLKRHQPAPAAKEDREHLTDLGSRCGFTNRYYYRHNGKDMVTFAKPNLEYRNEAFHQRITDTYVTRQKKIPAVGELCLKVGKEAEFSVRSGEREITVHGMAPMAAQKKPLSEEDVRNRMNKTGDTPFVFTELKVTMEDGIFLPNGALNQLRREGLEALEAELQAPYRRSLPESMRMKSLSDCGNEPARRKTRKMTESHDIRLIAGAEEQEQLEAVLSCPSVTDIYVDFRLVKELAPQAANAARPLITRIQENGKKCYIALPSICREDWKEGFLKQKEVLAGTDGFVVKNYESLELIRKNFPGAEIICDHNLYTYNDRACREFFRLGARRVTMPLELNAGEIRSRNNAGSEMILYGYYPLMTSAGCLKKNTAGCSHTPGKMILTDRYRTSFTVKNDCETCTNTIYNSLPACLMAHYGHLKENGLAAFRLQFTLENGEKTRLVLQAAERMLEGRLEKSDLEAIGPYTGGHYKRGVE